MEYKDFFRLFNVIQICDRSTIKNLHLDVKEDEGQCGVIKGCCVGCGKYWCCCAGLCEIYCGRVTSDSTIENNSCFPCLRNDAGRSWREE